MSSDEPKGLLIHPTSPMLDTFSISNVILVKTKTYGKTYQKLWG